LLSDSVNFCFTRVWLAFKYCVLVCWQWSRSMVLCVKYSDRTDWLSVACMPRMSVCLLWIVIIIVYIFVLPTLIWWIKVVCVTPTLLLPYSTPIITYLTPIATITLHLHYHYSIPVYTTTTTTTTITVMEVTFLTNYNNNLKWTNSSTNVVCWRHHVYCTLSTSAKFNDSKSVCFVSKHYFSPVFYLFYCAKK